MVPEGRSDPLDPAPCHARILLWQKEAGLAVAITNSSARFREKQRLEDETPWARDIIRRKPD